MLPSEVLRQARNEIMERGWSQGDYIASDGSVCAMGAIDIQWDHKNGAVLDRASTAFREATGIDCFIPIWNDTPGRTIHEVLDMFDKAEKLALIAEET